MQCGTCEGVCPSGAVRLTWDLRMGYRLSVEAQTCTDCGRCHDACPARASTSRRAPGGVSATRAPPARTSSAPGAGSGSAGRQTRRCATQGASGGVATALMQAALETGVVDAVVAVRMSAANPLEAEGVICRSPEEVAACRGSKYNAVAVNTALRQILEEPGRYALVGLPCHIQGLRLAQRRSRRLRERVRAHDRHLLRAHQRAPRDRRPCAPGGARPCGAPRRLVQGSGMAGRNASGGQARHGALVRLRRLHRPPVHGPHAAALPYLPGRARRARRHLRRRRLARPLRGVGRRERPHRYARPPENACSPLPLST